MLQNSDVVEIDACGHKIKALRSTFLKFQNSKLAKFFEDFLSPNFLNRPGFPKLVKYLQVGHFDDLELDIELDFWQIPKIIPEKSNHLSFQKFADQKYYTGVLDPLTCGKHVQFVPISPNFQIILFDN